MFFDVRVCNRLMAVAIKAMHTTSTHNILLESLLVLEQFRIMMVTQAIDVVSFDFKGTLVRCFVSGSTDYQKNFLGAKRF